MNEVLIAILGGIVGGIVSPILLDIYQRWQRDRLWAKPRKALLLNLLQREGKPFRTLETLARVTGTTDEECRTLLIELGARGARLDGGKEGWALITRAPFGTPKPGESGDFD